jgi:acetyl-CoA carboxylase biotin carboxylase subunit
MFDKILIANRGEIALRVDPRRPRDGHPASRCIPRPMPTRCMCAWPTRRSASARRRPRTATCHGRRSSPACEITGAEAIHPGYGFLSENANFVQIVEDHGITFIGPIGEHIRMMGDKITAKDTMKKLGVPCVPGSDGGVAAPGNGAGHRRRYRLPGHHQGHGRRRRARHEARPVRGRSRKRLPHRALRGQGGLRQ